MYGLPQLRHLNQTAAADRELARRLAAERAEKEAQAVVYDDEEGHGISEEETIVSDQAE